MEDFDLEAYVERSKQLPVADLDWECSEAERAPAEALRTLRYMQDIESHTVVYLKSLLSTRAIDDPEISTFLACWLYEETFHGRALARFLRRAGVEPVARERSRSSWADRLESVATSVVSRVWPDFVAVHMTWGAINELTTLTGYRRLAKRAGHPFLTELLGRIVRDESRHFQFYYAQAARRLRSERAARVTRAIVERFWAPVGSGVQPASETRFLAGYLFGGEDGRAATSRLDATIARLPGLGGLRLLEPWLAENL